ncbi:MAG: CpsD/CapB family tyrosine-protein kinase [Acholeplasmataceae bacterium]|nr:CpsD/CapB family tyrosine-protein kinase [Acholeplasmataceae bacterium]
MFNKHNNNENNYEIIVSTRPNSQYAESYRKLPIDIKYSSVDEEPCIIQVTSSVSGEHKTTTAANLAAVYVELGYKVVLFDCDLRRPQVHRAAGIINDEGLTDYLIDKIDYQKLIKKTVYGFDAINAGNKVPYPHVVLHSMKFKNLLDELRKEYDYIIIDCPPVLVVTDSLIIAQLVDTTLFVINQKLVKKSETKEALRLLKEAEAKIAGIVLSNVTGKLAKKQKSYRAYY